MHEHACSDSVIINQTHAIRGLRHILLATMSLSRAVGGSPRIQHLQKRLTRRCMHRGSRDVPWLQRILPLTNRGCRISRRCKHAWKRRCAGESLLHTGLGRIKFSLPFRTQACCCWPCTQMWVGPFTVKHADIHQASFSKTSSANVLYVLMGRHHGL